MFERILVGTDFSAPSEAMLSCLRQLAKVGLREVVLAHVVYVANTPGLEELLAQEARPLLEGMAQRLRDAGLQVTTDMRMGIPAVKLAEMADAHDVTATVVGSHGRSMLGRVLLGSVSSGLLNQTMRPVLIVRVKIGETATGTTCEAVCGGMLDRVLFPTDFSDSCAHAFDTLTEILAKTRGYCTLLHVQDETDMRHLMDRLPEFNATDTQRLEKLKAELVEAGASRVDVEVRLGKPIRVIIEQAEGHSLIVMSTRGRGALAEVMVGSVAMNVARLAPVPVLFVPCRC